jgi:hypothetical protein
LGRHRTTKWTRDDFNKPQNEIKEIMKKDVWNKEDSTGYERRV